MRTRFECIPCIINSFFRLTETVDIPELQQETILRRLLQELSRADYDHSPPRLGRMLHRMIRESLENPDPYAQIKEKYNRMMLGMYTSFKELVEKSGDPFNTAMRLAIAGNVIDFGSPCQLDVKDTTKQVMEAGLAIDDSGQLRKDAKNASVLLYIGDNCGEIVE